MMRRNFASLDLRALDGANASPIQLPASDPHEHLAQLRLEDEELHGVGCPLECLVAAPASAPTPMTTPAPQPRKETPLKTLTPTVLRPSPPIPMNTLRSSQPHHANGSASYCCAASAKRCWKCESHGSSPAALVSASYGSAIFQHDPVEALSLGVTSDRLASSPCVPMTRPSIPRNVVQSV
ncbi:hypothetical protein Poli38472_013500 [Pythium oligandrum]|uniref:Uncharacterized protein n=1 Tax=Pythium oligandrum TaxID=41045 RepID=A0A8K1C7F3_PYTOL|nr:hypothetical protein Poli38472_013500 [Pythium oligandrum]|eukprot:TMW58026.1 hypothetical protein Poli38472_013500 [Pythium oligandrum]